METNDENVHKKQKKNDVRKPKKKPFPAKRDASARTSDSAKEEAAPSPAESVPAPEQKSKTLYRVKFFYEWCKSCGICCAMCPKKIIMLDEQGHPYIEDDDECIGCRNCEIHCPDFAITVKKRYPERRKSNGS